jgi:cation transporter-like permease
MNDFEQKLLENGFSAKNIGKLKSIINKDESKKDTLQSLVIDLSKRFWGGVIALVILALIGLNGIFNADSSNAIPYIIVLTFAFFVVYFVTPLNLAWKSYKFIRKNKH